MQNMTTYEHWSLIIAVASVTINAILFMVVLLQLGALRQQIRESSAAEVRDHDRRRRQATMEAFSTTMDARRALRTLLPDDIDRAETGKIVRQIREKKSDVAHEQAVVDYLRLWENFAAGVNIEVLDLEMVDRIAGTHIMRLAQNYADWIAWRRKTWRSESLFSELEELAEAIRRRRGL